MVVQPNPDWPWSLSEGGNPVAAFDWHDFEFALEDLYPDNDSFLILEQRDPGNDKNFWYVQSAIALAGPDKGKYIIGFGFPGETGPVLLERCFEDLNDVIQLFEAAYDRQPLELSGYENFFD